MRCRSGPPFATDLRPPGLPGLAATFYAGGDLDGDITDALVMPVVFFNQEVGGPAGDSAEILGRLVLPHRGTYQILAQANDDVRIWIDGTKIIENWNGVSDGTPPYTLTAAAGPHDLRITWRNTIGLGSLVFYVQGPGIPALGPGFVGGWPPTVAALDFMKPLLFH